MIETETIERVPHEDTFASTQSGFVVSTEALSGRFINPPPGKLYLLYGAHEIFHLSLLVASKILGRYRPIAVVDGANRFDAYYLARVLREQYGNPEPLLNAIYVSRGFTCYQMEAAITQRLPQFLHRMKSKTAMIFGLLDTFYDEQAKFYEVQKSLQRILRKLHEMKREGVSILVASLEMKVLPEERNQLFRTLKSSADQIYRFEVSEERCRLVLESSNSALIYKPSSVYEYCHSEERSDEESRMSLEANEIPRRPEKSGTPRDDNWWRHIQHRRTTQAQL